MSKKPDYTTIRIEMHLADDLKKIVADYRKEHGITLTHSQAIEAWNNGLKQQIGWYRVANQAIANAMASTAFLAAKLDSGESVDDDQVLITGSMMAVSALDIEIAQLDPENFNPILEKFRSDLEMNALNLEKAVKAKNNQLKLK